MESLRGDEVLGKYEKIYRLTHPPLERVLKNMFDDGVSAEDIARFEKAANGDDCPASPVTAMAGDLERLEADKESRDVMKEMEARILDKMQTMIQEREDRIIAALTGRVAAAPAPAPAAPAPAAPAPAAPAPAAPAAAPAAPAPKPPAPKPPPPAKKTSSAPSEVIESTLADSNKDNWVAIPGIKSTSGVQCETSCKEGYNKVRLDRSGIRWVIFEFDKSMEWIYPAREGVQTEDFVADWDGFVEALPDKKACYGLYNFQYMDAGGSGYAMAGQSVLKNKMVLFSWTDSACKVRDRMVAASSQSAIKQVCRGSCDCSVHDKPDMSYENICKELDCNI